MFECLEGLILRLEEIDPDVAGAITSECADEAVTPDGVRFHGAHQVGMNAFEGLGRSRLMGR